MSLSTLRKNFYRIASLIIDHGAESLRSLLYTFIQKIHRVSFKDFVSNHQHEIYHQFNNSICCQCSKNYRRPFKAVISVWQMETLFDKNCQKLLCHKHNSKCEYCCSIVKSNLQLQHIDITLLRFFLVTFFEEEFLKSSLSGGLLLHDFLNTHKHDIFHLLQLNTPCCLCLANPEYMIMAVNEKDRLNRTQWETMFQAPVLPCDQHRKNHPNGYTMNPCSVTASIGIHFSDFDSRTRMTILSKFCIMMKNTDQLVNARNTVFAHAIKAELSDNDFCKLWNEIENSIIYISNITNTVDSRTFGIQELKESSLDESMCLEIQCLILRQMQEDEHILLECRKMNDTFALIKDIIDDKLHLIESQLLALTSNITNAVKDEILVQLNEYSDTTRNIIDNSRKEIEFHDEDKLYYKTSAVTAGVELLDSTKIIILIGKAGIGKSTTALEIASIYQNKGYIVMKLEQDIAMNFKTLFISKNKQLVIFEDLFGKADASYNENMHSNLFNVLQPHISNGFSKFLITVRGYEIGDEADITTCHPLLSKAGVINLNGNFSLSVLEKKRIFSRYAKYYELEINYHELPKIVYTDTYLGFPETCRLFYTFKNFYRMGYTFFTSPTDEFQKEIRALKRSGNTDNKSALQYCVLVSLVINVVCKVSFLLKRDGITHQNNSFKNVNSSVVEYVYYLLFKKPIKLTVDDLQDICKELSKKYIRKNVNNDIYVFQHNTVFQTVLSSYWDESTMVDVIQFCSVIVLSEYVRPFDSLSVCDKGNMKYLIVPKSKCMCLAQKSLDIILTSKYPIWVDDLECSMCIKMIDKSELTINYLNHKLTEWFKTKGNILDCKWLMITQLFRPSNYINKDKIICAYADDKSLMQRLINELNKPNGVAEVMRYIKTFGCKEFVRSFNKKLTEFFRTKDNVMHSTWELIDNCVRPASYKIENCQVGAPTEDNWLINRLIEDLVESPSDMSFTVLKYIETWGCETFLKMFNDRLKKWLILNENDKYDWDLIEDFVRPTSFRTTNNQRSAITDDSWLINRLLSELTFPSGVSHVKKYMRRFGYQKQFVRLFNDKLRVLFLSEYVVANCRWKLINEFVCPTTFEIGNDKVSSYTANDNWLIDRLISELVKPNADDSTKNVKEYIEKYKCDHLFVRLFNDKLRVLFLSEYAVANCTWTLINEFVCPTTFEIGNDKVGSYTANDNWLIDRLISELVKPYANNVKKYIEKYKCDQFVKHFNAKFTIWCKLNLTLEHCSLEFIRSFIRPTSVKTNYNEIGAFTNDDCLIKVLIHRLVEPGHFHSTYYISKYIGMYGNDEFINNFNTKLTIWCESDSNIANCSWGFLESFIRPTTVRNKRNEIGALTNDNCLIETLIHRMLEPSMPHPFIVRKYLIEYGNEEFINNFNGKLMERFDSETNVLNCEWAVMKYFLRPTTFIDKKCQIGTKTNSSWLILKLVNELLKQNGDSLHKVLHYVKNYGCGEFVQRFKENLTKAFQSELDVLSFSIEFIRYLIRPTTYKINHGEICIFTTDSLLIQRLVNELVEKVDSKQLGPYKVKQYIEKYGLGTFIIQFNEKLTKWFQSEDKVVNCEWELFKYFVRPTTFKIDNDQIGIQTNDIWLIQRLINELIGPENNTAWTVKDFISSFGCAEFINHFNSKSEELFQSDNYVVNCSWYLIDYFLRPNTWKVENGEIGIRINNNWLVQRLMQELVKPDDYTASNVHMYIKTYGCGEIMENFNNKLTEWIQSEENVLKCSWNLINKFICPTTFNRHNDQMKISTNDSWLIQRLVKELLKSRTPQKVQNYIETYKCVDFTTRFNARLSKWFQVRKNEVNCPWKLINCFIRPDTFKIENGNTCITKNDSWIIQRIIHELVNSDDYIATEVKRYIKSYGCGEFVRNVNEKLSECFQFSENVKNCPWEVIDEFVRPSTFKIENGKLGTITNNICLIRRLLDELLKRYQPEWVHSYIKKYGCEEFINDFNKTLTERIQSEQNIEKCSWEIIYYFLRPTTFKLENGQIGILIKNSWLVHRMVNILADPLSEWKCRMINPMGSHDILQEVQTYIRQNAHENFVKHFKKELTERFQIEDNDPDNSYHIIDRIFPSPHHSV